MRKTLFRICMILAACLALEAAVFVAWKLVHRSVPAETVETEARTEPSTANIGQAPYPKLFLFMLNR